MPMNVHTTTLLSCASKLMLKLFHPRLQRSVNRELPDVQHGVAEESVMT